MGIIVTCLSGIAAIYSVIYLHAIAWFFVFGLCLSAGYEEWIWLTKKAYLTKPQRIYCSITTAFVIALFGLGLMTWFPLTTGDPAVVAKLGEITNLLTTKKDPIAVSPSEEKLTKLFHAREGLRGVINFSVYNRGDDPYHQIWIKLIIESDFLSPKSLDLVGNVDKHPFVNDNGGVYCDAGEDKNSRMAILCLIDSLAPKKSLPFKITSNYNVAHMSDEQIGKVFIIVSGFSSNPLQTYENQPGKQKAFGFKANIPDSEKGFTTQR